MSYFNGSDLLIKIGSEAIGHCTSHSITYTAETKEHTVKPAFSVTPEGSFYKEKTVVGLSVSVKGDGLVYVGETELSLDSIRNLWSVGKAVTVEAYHRGKMSPYMTGPFVITSLEETAPAGDDTTFSISLENAGKVEFHDGLAINPSRPNHAPDQEEGEESTD